MIQSMARVGKRIENGPMEGFWGSLKRGHSCVKRFAGRETLVNMIEDYISSYNSDGCSVA